MTMTATVGVIWFCACVMPYRGSWYVCFSAMNCEPAVYMSKIFFSEVTDSSEEQMRVLPKRSVLELFCFALV